LNYLEDEEEEKIGLGSKRPFQSSMDDQSSIYEEDED